MRERYGFGFREWTTFCVAFYAGLDQAELRYPAIDEGFLRDSASTIGRHPRLANMFGLLSATSEEVGAQYRALRARKGYLLHDPALPTLFAERPLLRPSEGQYIAVHKPLVFTRGLEGPYDISMAPGHWGEVFGREFGAVFERYVGQVLANLPDVRVVTEREMRRCTPEKICDYLVVGDDFVLFVEAKAVKYSATLVSELAIRQDNSTTKIAEAVDQFFSAANLVQAGVLRDCIGAASGKAFLAVVVTFRPIYQANDDAYWGEAILPLVKAPGKDDWRGRFAFRPQVMAVSELEQLVLVAAERGATPLALYREKLTPPPIRPVVSEDWEDFLVQRLGEGQRFPLWSEAWSTFIRDIIATFQLSNN